MGFSDVIDRAFNLAGAAFGAAKGGAQQLAGQGWERFASEFPPFAGGGDQGNLPTLAGGGGAGGLAPVAGGGWGGGGLPTLAGGGGLSALPTLAGNVNDPTRSAANVQAGQAAYDMHHPRASSLPAATTYGNTTGGGGTWTPSTADGNAAAAWVATTKPNSPLASIAPDIVAYARSKGIDPGMIFGVLQNESGLATDGGMGVQQNNPGNIMAAGADPANGKVILRSYASMLEGVKAMVDLFAGYGQTYGAKTVEDMIATYYVGPEAYKRYGLEANDAGGSGHGGNGTVREYLDRAIYPTMQSFGATRSATGTVGQPAIDNGRRYIGLAYTNQGIRDTGNPNDGFDCSSLTGYLLGLPRNLWNAQAQANAAQRIDASQLQVGDLIFFQGTNPDDPSAQPVSHVGIYAGNGRMLNAQNDGVREVDLNSRYWQDHLWGYGRMASTGR